MAARLHLLGSDHHLSVDESPSEAAQFLWGDDGQGYAELHANKKPVLVNPAAVAYIDEPGEPHLY